MSHFYRLHNPTDYNNQGDFIWMSSYRPSGKDDMLPIEWTRAMEEIPQTPPWPHCKVLRAPLYPAGYEQDYSQFVVKPGTEIPDIYCPGERLLVSAKARAVLESCDDFEHEYIETEIQDVDRQRINTEPYYLMSVRRFLCIDELGGKVANWQRMFFPRPVEDDFLPRLQQTPELLEKVAQLPLWRHELDLSVVYLSEQVLSALRAAGISGLKDYSHATGEPGECVARFEA